MHSAKKPSLLTLILLISFASVGAIISAPSLPEIAEFFGVSPGTAQHLMSVFLLGFSLGQLLYGPISNRFGRKPAAFIGIFISAIGSLLCALSGYFHAFHLLLLSRFIMALGGAVGLTLAMTITADYFAPSEVKKINATVITAFAFMPGLATLVGGILGNLFGWQSCFYFFMLYAAFLAFLVSKLSETLKIKQPKALYPSEIIQNYRKVLSNRSLIANALVYGSFSAIIYVYGAFAPFIAVNQLHLSARQYGALNLISYLGFLSGIFLFIHLAKRFSTKQCLQIGFGIVLFSSLLLFFWFFYQKITIFTLMFSMFFIMIGGSSLISNASFLAQSQLSDKSNALAMMNTIGLFTSFLGTVLIGHLQPHGYIMMPLVFLGFCAFIALNYMLIIHLEPYETIP